MDDLNKIAKLTKKYMQHPSLKVVAVLSEDVAGMTYVARWVRSDSLKDIPEDASWASLIENKK